MYVIYKKEASIEAINNNDVAPIAVCDTYDDAEAIVKEDDNGDAKYV